MSKFILLIALPVALLLAIVVVTHLFGAGALAQRPSAAPPGLTNPARTPIVRQASPTPPGLPPTLAAPEPTVTPASTEPASTPVAEQDPTEWVVIAHTGAQGGVVRAEPVTGRQVAAPRDGERLQVLGRTAVSGAEWFHVRTFQGVEGWVAARIVMPAEQARN